MRRLVGLWACAVLLVGLIAFQSGGGAAIADETDDATIAALETKVAKQATSIAKRDAKIDELRTRIADNEAEQAVEPTSTPQTEEASNDGAVSALVGGNAIELLAGGDVGVLTVSAVGPYDGSQLPVIVRNNTDQDMVDITVSAVARSANGELIAAGGDLDFVPHRVPQGGFALGYIYFDGITLPPDVEFEFTVDGQVDTGDYRYAPRDLEVVDAAFLGDRIVGELINNTEVAISAVGVSVICVDGSGAVLGFERGYVDQDEVKAGATAPFQVSLYRGIDCTNFLVAANGYNF